MPAEPQGAVIEILERRDRQYTGPEGEVIVPNEVRINGQALLCSADHPITVHEIEMADRKAVLVTFTVFAKRVVVGAEEPHPTSPEGRKAALWGGGQ